MATLLEKAVCLTAKGFDIERKKLYPPGTWAALLSLNKRDQVFNELRIYEKGFITRTPNFRTGFYLEIATLDNLQADILKIAYFSISGRCYAVGEGDITEPSGDRFSWMIWGTFVKDFYTRP